MASLPDIATILVVTALVAVVLTLALGRLDPDPRSHPHRTAPAPRRLARD